MGTRRFLGVLTAEPSTVKERLISGFPVSRYLSIKATEATFITTQPTSAGSFPGGTRLPVAESTIIFSAPCGYLERSAMIFIEGSLLSSISFRKISMALGLLSSTAIMT